MTTFVKPSRPAVISGAEAQERLIAVTGDKELIARLAQFRDSGIRRVMSAALRASVKESAKVLKQRAPRPDVKKSIGWSVQKLSSPTQAQAKAGVNVGRRPQRYQIDDTRLLASGGATKKQERKIRKAQRIGYAVSSLVWIVVGTTARFTQAGAFRGRLRKLGFLQPAIAFARSRIMGAAKAAAEKQIEKEIGRARSRA